MGRENLKWTLQDSSIFITERDRIFECRGKNIKAPLDWMYVNPSRLKKNKALLQVISNNQREGIPFIINEQRYRLVNDEIDEVIV